MVFICAMIILSIDAVSVIQKEYSKVTDKNDYLIRQFIHALINVVIKSKTLSYDKSNCDSEEDTLNFEIKRMEEVIRNNRNQRDILNDEISFIDGNIHAVNCLINKYKFEDMNNDNTLVQFIEDKRLNKVIGTTESY